MICLTGTAAEQSEKEKVEMSEEMGKAGESNGCVRVEATVRHCQDCIFCNNNQTNMPNSYYCEKQQSKRTKCGLKMISTMRPVCELFCPVLWA
jgi:hypothetical protein